MLALKRLLHFTSHDSDGQLTVFDQLVSDLRVSIAQRLALEPDELNGWPEGTWDGDVMEAKANQWQDAAQPSSHLLELDWRESVAGLEWHLKLNLARSGTVPIVMEETWWVDTTGRALPFEDLPNVTRFTERLEAINRDGLRAGKTLVLGADRLSAFREYLLSTTRALPVVVFSPRSNGEERDLATELARHLMGAAVVLRFDLATQTQFNEIVALHRCYNGAVRLYMPGYQEADQQWRHPYWQTTVDPVEVRCEVVDRVARESVLFEPCPEIVRLRERRDQSRRNEYEAWRRRAREEERMRSVAEASLEENKGFYEVLMQEVDRLAGENDVLKATIGKQDDQIRQLEWRINQQWSPNLVDAEAPPVEHEGIILLSRQAQTTYRSFDVDERNYWDRHLFPKLLQPELRDKQTRKIKSIGAACFVFPRKRTADGRRIIYYLDGNDICVCEIFTSSQHDSDYDRLNTTGVDQHGYDGFVDLTNLVADVDR